MGGRDQTKRRHTRRTGNKKKERPRRTPRGTKPRGKNARGHARARPARACTCSLAPARGACLRAPAQMHRRELESARVRTWVSGRGKDGAPPLFGTSNLLAECFHSVFFWRKKFVKKATCKMIPRIYSSKTTRVFYITFESTRDAFRHSDESVMISNVGIHSKRNLEFSAEVSIIVV